MSEKKMNYLLRSLFVIILLSIGIASVSAQTVFRGKGDRAADDCLDYTNLYGPNVLCQYGTFANPYQNIGVQSDRHTVMASGTDPYSGFTCVPPGYTHSIRLGNSSVGAQAEGITYTYLVDTNQYDIILLTWSAVLQDPSHSYSNNRDLTFHC